MTIQNTDEEKSFIEKVGFFGCKEPKVNLSKQHNVYLDKYDTDIHSIPIDITWEDLKNRRYSHEFYKLDSKDKKPLITKLFVDIDYKIKIEQEDFNSKLISIKQSLTQGSSTFNFVYTNGSYYDEKQSKLSFHIIYQEKYIDVNNFNIKDEKIVDIIKKSFKYLDEELLNNLINTIDERIYTTNKCLRLPYGTQDEKPNIHIPQQFTSVDKYFISYIPPRSEKYDIIGKKKEQPKDEVELKRKERKERNISLESEDIDYYTSLVDLLSVKRANDYGDWINVGFCLFNIFQGTEKGLELFDRFSKKSPEGYDKIGVEKLYEIAKPKDKELTLGSLIYWAKNDNLEEFKKLTNSRNVKIINSNKGVKLSHEDIAKVYYEMYARENIKLFSYGKAGVKSYIFNKNTCLWELKKGMNEIYKEVSKIVSPVIIDCIKEWSEKLVNADKTEGRMIQERIQQYTNAICQLKSSSFLKGVYDMLEPMIKEENVVNKINKDVNFLSLKNKKKLSLIDGKIYDKQKSDFWSIELVIDYDEDADTSLAEEIFRTTFVDTNKNESKELVDFCQIIFGYYLTGNVEHGKFYIHNGSGHNGKSFIFNAVKEILETKGDGKSLYQTIDKQAIITDGKKNSKTTSPELFDFIHARVCVSNEPKQGEVLNDDVLKLLTGHDEISARGLYQEEYTKFITASKVCILTNHRPKFNTEDDAIVSRICIIPYNNKFLLTNKSVIDRKSRCMAENNKYKPEFLSSLFKFLIKGAIKSRNLNREFVEPKECKDASKNYKDENDMFLNFMNDNYEKITEEDFNKLNEKNRVKKSYILDGIKFFCLKQKIDFEKHKISIKLDEEFGIKKTNKGIFSLVKSTSIGEQEQEQEEKPNERILPPNGIILK